MKKTEAVKRPVTWKPTHRVHQARGIVEVMFVPRTKGKFAGWSEEAWKDGDADYGRTPNGQYWHLGVGPLDAEVELITESSEPPEASQRSDLFDSMITTVARELAKVDLKKQKLTPIEKTEALKSQAEALASLIKSAGYIRWLRKDERWDRAERKDDENRDRKIAERAAGGPRAP